MSDILCIVEVEQATENIGNLPRLFIRPKFSMAYESLELLAKKMGTMSASCSNLFKIHFSVVYMASIAGASFIKLCTCTENMFSSSHAYQ